MTYSIESAKAQFAQLLRKAANGEEVLITENDKPIAKIVSADETEAYRRRIQSLRGSLKGIDTEVYRDEEDRV